MKLKYKDMTFDIEDFGGIFNICNLYIFLWCIYFAQDGLKIGGTVIAQLALMFNLLITFYTFVRTMVNGKIPFVLKVLGLMIIIFTIYGMEIIIYQKEFYIEMTTEVLPPIAYIRAIYISIVPIYTYYYFTERGLLTEKAIRWWTFVFLVASFLIFRTNVMKVLEYSNDEEAITNNAGYLFLALIPAICFFKKNLLLQYGLLAVCLVMMLVSVKRGALIIGIMSLMWFFVKQYSDMTRKQKFIVTFVITLLLCAITVFIIHLVATNEYFIKRFFDFMDGNSSHRDVLYAVFLDHFMNLENPIQILFGMGANSTLEIGENLAHNDWIEILTNQGIVGVIIYSAYWIAFFLYVFKSKKNSNTLHTALGILFIVFFMKTFFSMSYADIAFSASPVFGYCFAKTYQTLHENENLRNIPELSK